MTEHPVDLIPEEEDDPLWGPTQVAYKVFKEIFPEHTLVVTSYWDPDHEGGSWRYRVTVDDGVEILTAYFPKYYLGTPVGRRLRKSWAPFLLATLTEHKASFDHLQKHSEPVLPE